MNASRPRPSRRRVFAAAGAVMSLLLFGIVWVAMPGDEADDRGAFPLPGPLRVTVPGDLDGNDVVTAAETAEATAAERTATKFVQVLSPKKGRDVATLAVTPAGERWWEFVTSQTEKMMLWSAGYPEDALWYSVTWGKRYLTDVDGGRIPSYPALHVAFASEQEMFDWVEDIPLEKRSVGFLYRGSVVTIVPSYLDHYAEPFPRKLRNIMGEKQTTGFWSVDYVKQIGFDSQETYWPGPYRTFWEKFGFADVTWSAVSRDPRRWVGTIHGWDAAAVDPGAAYAALTSTMSKDGDKLNAAPTVTSTYFWVPGADVGSAQTNLRPDNAPGDADLILTNTPGFRGLAMEGASVTAGPVTLWSRWVRDDVMTVEPWFNVAVEKLPKPATVHSASPEPVPGVSDDEGWGRYAEPDPTASESPAPASK